MKKVILNIVKKIFFKERINIMNRFDKRSSITIKNIQDICINASMNTFEQIKYYSD